jgi:hypothetical protein
MNPAEWPWYEVVNDDSLDQGDIIPGCLVLHAVAGEDDEEPEVELRPATILVLTQTCDLAWAKDGQRSCMRDMVCGGSHCS